MTNMYMYIYRRVYTVQRRSGAGVPDRVSRAYINVDAGLARVILFDAFYSCFLVYMDFHPHRHIMPSHFFY
jgi:hypothetical protein